MAKENADLRRARSRPTPRRRGLAFVSHDARDQVLAEAFENLLRVASGGVLKTFRSSDKTGYSGIAFGAEWYATIMDRLQQATDVVALITPNSADRPWILYEVGVARGRANVTAFGVAFDVPLHQIGGPFAQFHNCADDEDSLTKLVMQLMMRVPDAAPRVEAIRLHVGTFRAHAAKLRYRPQDVAAPPPANTVLFEEVKAMFHVMSDQLKSLNQRVTDTLREPTRLPAGSSLSLPAWAKDVDDLLGDLKLARNSERRLAIWKKLISILSARYLIHPHSLISISDAIRLNNRVEIKTGVTELRHFVKENIRTANKNEAYLYDVLRRLADVADEWSH